MDDKIIIATGQTLSNILTVIDTITVTQPNQDQLNKTHEQEDMERKDKQVHMEK